MQCKYLLITLCCGLSFAHAESYWSLSGNEPTRDIVEIQRHYPTARPYQEPYAGIVAEYGNAHGQSASSLSFQLGAPIQSQPHVRDNAYQQGYQDGYDAGFQAAQRRQIYRPPQAIHDEMQGHYVCELKVGTRTFQARGEYRDSARRHVYKLCRQHYSRQRCQQARADCQTDW